MKKYDIDRGDKSIMVCVRNDLFSDFEVSYYYSKVCVVRALSPVVYGSNSRDADVHVMEIDHVREK